MFLSDNAIIPYLVGNSNIFARDFYTIYGYGSKSKTAFGIYKIPNTVFFIYPYQQLSRISILCLCNFLLGFHDCFVSVSDIKYDIFIGLAVFYGELQDIRLEFICA